MAKGKKKETLTPEERLQAALVPESEQPYKLPENWCWTKVGDLCTFIGGGTPDKTNPLYWNGNISWASVKDIKGSYLYSTIDKISQVGLECSSSNLCEAGDLLLITRIEPAKAIVSKIVTAINQDLKIVKSELSSLFLYYYFCAFQHEFEKKASGSTVKGITLPNIQNTPFPLPPLPEQQRIVDRIESLFAKLEEAKQKAQDALDSFETRKAAILHKAFTGELTAQWRKEHGETMESWEKKQLSQLAKQIKAGGDKPDDFTTIADEIHNIPVIANGVTDEGIVGYTATSRFSGETITVAGRGTIGFSMYRTYPFFPIVRLIVIEPQDTVKAAYIKYAFDAFPENGTGSSIPQLTVPMVKEKIIPLPKLNEQTEIVRILDDLLAKEQQAKEAAEGVLEQIDLIKKAILARAFRGELGTNDPKEESAVELLKQVLSC